MASLKRETRISELRFVSEFLAIFGLVIEYSTDYSRLSLSPRSVWARKSLCDFCCVCMVVHNLKLLSISVQCPFLDDLSMQLIVFDEKSMLQIWK